MAHLCSILTAALAVAILSIACHRRFKMLDIKALQDEVNAEIAKEETTKAKSQLKQITRDIQNAKQLVANLERKRADLLVAIGEGTN